MGLSPAGARHGQGGLGEVPALPALRPQPPLLGESEQVAAAAPLRRGLREPGRESGPWVSLMCTPGQAGLVVPCLKEEHLQTCCK